MFRNSKMHIIYLLWKKKLFKLYKFKIEHYNMIFVALLCQTL